MNLREDLRQLQTDNRELRKFGLMVGGVFVLLGLLFLWRHPGRSSYFLWPGGVLMLAGAIFPRGLKWVYVAWMSAAIVLGFVMAHVVLTVLFFLVITPVGLVARIFGKDFLRMKLDRRSGTYWIRRDQKARAPADYEKQF